MRKECRNPASQSFNNAIPQHEDPGITNLSANTQMPENLEEQFVELRYYIQQIRNEIKEIRLDIAYNRNVTLTTSYYLEEVDEKIKALQDKSFTR